MRFFKENSYDVVRLYINQIGISIFSMVLYTAVGTIELSSKLLDIGLSVFLMGFYFALIYTASWEYGAKDKIRIDAGKIEPVSAKGTRLALLAGVPNYLLSGLCLVFGLIYKATLSSGVGVAAGLFNTFMRLSMAMYLGIVQSIFGSFTSAADDAFALHAAGFLFAHILAVAVISVGYYLGSKDKRIFAAFSKGNKK